MQPRTETPLKESGPSRPAKSVTVAYLWWFFLGLFGVHQFSLGRTGRRVLYLCTLGVCGLGWPADAFTLPRQIRSTNARTALRDATPRADATADPGAILSDPVH